MIRLVVRVRNVGNKEVKFQYLREFLIERLPIVTDVDGKAVRQWKLDAGGFSHLPEPVSLAPGKEFELADEEYEIWPAKGGGKSSTLNSGLYAETVKSAFSTSGSLEIPRWGE